MKITIAFDVYGTLINTHGVVSALREVVGDQAQVFSMTWRDKQLEYSFRRGLMEKYEDFSVCTSHALDYACRFYKVSLSEQQKAALLDSYKVLPAFDDVKQGLDMLNKPDFEGYAFSNGSAKTVDQLLSTAGIRQFFDGVVSVESLKTFKPNPIVYHHFIEQSNANPENTWLVSSNPFDVIGAMSVGMKSAWVQRSVESIFDPWGIEPTITINSLADLCKGIQSVN